MFQRLRTFFIPFFLLATKPREQEERQVTLLKGASLAKEGDDTAPEPCIILNYSLVLVLVRFIHYRGDY